MNRGNKKSGNWITPKKRLAIYLRDGFTCLYCDTDLAKLYLSQWQRDITLDHLIPESKGGLNIATNLVTACRSCNSARQDKPISVFATEEAKKKISRHRQRKLKKYLKEAQNLLDLLEVPKNA